MGRGPKPASAPSHTEILSQETRNNPNQSHFSYVQERDDRLMPVFQDFFFLLIWNKFQILTGRLPTHSLQCNDKDHGQKGNPRLLCGLELTLCDSSILRADPILESHGSQYQAKNNKSLSDYQRTGLGTITAHHLHDSQHNNNMFLLYSDICPALN